MILDIVTGKDNKILRSKSKPIDDVADPKIQKLIKDMQETLENSENGIGLAAPQIGRNLQVFVIDPEFSKDGHTVFINPEITKVSRKKVVLDEGCLSVPGKWDELGRPEKATIKAINENGKKFKVRGKGILARLFCHEVDHLKGVLFIDHLNH